MVGPECAIPLQTSIENLKAIPDAVKEWHKERVAKREKWGGFVTVIV